MKTKIREEKIERTLFYIICPVCKQKIKGTGSDHVIKNLRTHFLTKHPEKAWEKEVVW